MSKKDTLIATCAGLGIKLDPNIFDVTENGVVTLNSVSLQQVRGIKTITGNIDGENTLTLDITLTDESKQTVTGKITPTV